jgi:hypothetical protein
MFHETSYQFRTFAVSYFARMDLKKTNNRLGFGKANPKLEEKLPSDQFK